jgi:hypothetical protein
VGTECAHGKSAGGGNTWADPSNREVDRKVLNTRRAFHSQKYDEANRGNSHAAHDEWCSHSSTIGQFGYPDASQETQEIRGDDQLGREESHGGSQSRLAYRILKNHNLPNSQLLIEQSPSPE